MLPESLSPAPVSPKMASVGSIIQIKENRLPSLPRMHKVQESLDEFHMLTNFKLPSNEQDWFDNWMNSKSYHTKLDYSEYASRILHKYH